MKAKLKETSEESGLASTAVESAKTNGVDVDENGKHQYDDLKTKGTKQLSKQPNTRLLLEILFFP